MGRGATDTAPTLLDGTQRARNQLASGFTAGAREASLASFGKYPDLGGLTRQQADRSFE